MTSLPNILTIGRILSAPVIAILVISGSDALYLPAFLIFGVAAITDFFDGYLARKLNAISELGRILDPIADKLLVGVLLIALTRTPLANDIVMIAAIMILFREFFVSGLRESLSGELIIHVTFLAKIKTTLQLIAIGMMLLALSVEVLILPAQILLIAATILTLVTGVQYFNSALRHIAKE